MGEEERILDELENLRKEHRSLDLVINDLGTSQFDQIRMQRLKRRKLQIKDQISQLESFLYPDIIA